MYNTPHLAQPEWKQNRLCLFPETLLVHLTEIPRHSQSGIGIGLGLAAQEQQQ
jgi:hypothetical protein